MSACPGLRSLPQGPVRGEDARPAAAASERFVATSRGRAGDVFPFWSRFPPVSARSDSRSRPLPSRGPTRAALTAPPAPGARPPAPRSPPAGPPRSAASARRWVECIDAAVAGTQPAAGRPSAGGGRALRSPAGAEGRAPPGKRCGGRGPPGDGRPGSAASNRAQRARATPGYLYRALPGPPPSGSPRQTNGVLAAVLQQQLVEQSSAGRKKAPCSLARRRGPSPPAAPAPGPSRPDSPGDPASRVPGRASSPTRAPASPAPSPRPRGRRRSGRGRGGPARGPPGRPHAPSRPRSFPAFPV